jgi:hypothetical protein
MLVTETGRHAGVSVRLLKWIERQKIQRHVLQREVVKLTYCPCVLGRPRLHLHVLE